MGHCPPSPPLSLFLLSKCFQFLLGAEEGDLPTTTHSVAANLFFSSALPFELAFLVYARIIHSLCWYRMNPPSSKTLVARIRYITLNVTGLDQGRH